MLSAKTLPVHGFALAGGKSSRMGADKATLHFLGRPMVEIAVEKLREICAEVSIVGNREDLCGYAEVVGGERVDCGPAAGIEAGLKACRQAWAMFVPVDCPLVPVDLLRRWAVEMVEKRCVGSILLANKERQPGFSIVRRDAVEYVTAALDGGARRLDEVVMAVDGPGLAEFRWVSAERLTPDASRLDVEFWFSNLNTPAELEEAEMWARERNG